MKDEETVKLTIHVPESLNLFTQALVIEFAEAMASKFRKAELKYGYNNGWMESDWEEECLEKFQEHVKKGDPLDVANFCAFIWHHGWKTK